GGVIWWAGVLGRGGSWPQTDEGNPDLFWRPHVEGFEAEDRTFLRPTEFGFGIGESQDLAADDATTPQGELNGVTNRADGTSCGEPLREPFGSPLKGRELVVGEDARAHSEKGDARLAVIVLEIGFEDGERHLPTRG